MASFVRTPVVPSSRRSHVVRRASDSQGRRPEIHRFKLHDIYLATCGFHCRLLVANASLSQIFVAKLSDQTPVFVKRSRPGDRFWDSQRALENERAILSACRGTYLLNVVGFSDDTMERILVLEHAGRGNLFEALHNESLDPIRWPLRVQIAHHIAVALRGLHGARSQIVHRDVRSSNVWIADDWSAKLGGLDFALKVSMSSNMSPANCLHKSMAEIDPEYHNAEYLCAKTDVYCFGVLLLEMISGRKAVDVKNSPPFVVDWALPLVRQSKVNMLCDPRGRLPFRNSKVVLEMARIGVRCVNRISSRRPSMVDVAEELKSLLLDFPSPHGKNCCKDSDWFNVPHSRSIMFDRSLCTTVKAHPSIAETKLTKIVRSERPSMMFGLLEPRNIPPRSFLNVLEDSVARKQREPYLPPHLRHGFP